MVASVVLVQHAEKVREPGNPPLTPLGLRQAAAAAAALATRAPVALVTSPLLRARQTGEAIAAATGLVPTRDDRLRERLNLEVGDDVTAFFATWERTAAERDWTPPGGRSGLSCAADMVAALSEHAVEGDLVVAVGHGGATTDLLRSLLGDDALAGRAPGLIRDGVPGGALTHLTRNEGSWRVEAIAVVDHLDPAERSGHAR